MTAPLPFTNQEAKECAKYFEDIANQSGDMVSVSLPQSKARKLIETLLWVATERTEEETGTNLILSGNSKVPVKADTLAGALAEVASEALKAGQRRDFEAGTLFAYWQSVTDNKHITWTREKATRAQKAIRLFGFEVCLWAVDGVMGHPNFNQKDGSEHHNFSTIFNHDETERTEQLAQYARKRNKVKRHRMITRLIEKGYQPKEDS